MQKRHRMINKIKKKYWRTTHKYGIWIPKSVNEALQIDKENGNSYWGDAIRKEMSKAQVSYQVVDGTTPEQVWSNQVDALQGYQEI